MRIEPYAETHVAGVKAFNRRMRDKGTRQEIAEHPVPEWLPPAAGETLYQELFVAVDEAGVHGGYILKHQSFWLDGQEVRTADYRYPLSEGIVDSRYGMVGMLTVKDAMRRQPLAFGLGMGSRNEPVARLLKIVKWQMADCPFFFRICRPKRFLRGIEHLRRRPLRRRLLDLLAWTGVGTVAILGLQTARTLTSGRDAHAGTVLEFEAWADEIWERSRREYRFIAVRTAHELNRLYPKADSRFCRILIRDAEGPVGWAVFLDTAMKDHKQFGNLRVGSIVDCLALPGAEAAVVSATTNKLSRRGVDMIVSNQLHHAWCTAFRKNGYLRGPSNFIFTAAPQLAAQLQPFSENADKVHMTRGDGDGPINL